MAEVMEEIVEEEVKQLLLDKQYTRLRQKVAELNNADIADVMQELENEDKLKLFRFLPKGIASLSSV